MTKALEIRDLTKRFGAHQALDGVACDVGEAEAVVVLGPSGCGKTTLLRAIAGLEVPDSGEIRLDGVLASGARRTLLAPHERQIGFVFQDLALWPHMTVEGNIGFVLAARRVAPKERAEKIREILSLVRVETLAPRYPHQLSGGEQQRVALARALVGDPRLLLLDEPLSSLDSELRAILRDELQRLQQKLQLAMVYVTHDRDDATALADRVFEMRAGRVVSIVTSQGSGGGR